MQMRRQLLDKCSFPKHARLYDFIEFSNHALSCPLDFMSCSVVSEVMPHSATSRAGGGDSTMVDWNSGVNTTSTQQCGCTQMTCSKHQQPLESARQLQRGRPAPQFCPGLQPPYAPRCSTPPSHSPMPCNAANTDIRSSTVSFAALRHSNSIAYVTRKTDNHVLESA